MAKALAAADSVCPTARSFFALRRTASRLTPLPRRSLRPDTAIELAIPRRGRRQVWRELRRAHAFVPDLVPSAAGRCFLGGLGWVLFFGWVGVSAGAGHAWGPLAAAVSLPAGLAMGAMWQATSHLLSNELPGECVDLGALARRITPAMPAGAGLAARVLQDVRRITAEQCGCELADVQPETRYVDDLGLD